MAKGSYERIYYEHTCEQCGEGYRSIKKKAGLCEKCVAHNRKSRWRFNRRHGIVVGRSKVTVYQCEALLPEVEFGVLVGWMPCGKDFELTTAPRGKPRCEPCRKRESMEQLRRRRKTQDEGGWKTLVYTPEELEIWDTLYGGVDALRMRLEEEERIAKNAGRML